MLMLRRSWPTLRRPKAVRPEKAPEVLFFSVRDMLGHD